MGGEQFSRPTYLGLTWFLFVIAVIFFCARILLRWKLYRRLHLDDGLVALSVLMLAIICIIQTAYVDNTFKYQAFQTKGRKANPKDEKDTRTTFAHYQWAIAYLYFTGLWAVKGSFLAFYDQLTQRLHRMRQVWWAVIVFTVLTYIGSLFAYGFLNGNQFKESLRNKAINYQFAVDLSTDVMITAIPLTLALRSSIPRKQKLTLSAVFSITLVITIFAIVRYSLNNPHRAPSGPTWIEIWSIIEHSVSICVASVASFRAFVVQQHRHSSNRTPPFKLQPGSSSSARTPRGPNFARLGSRQGSFSDQPQGPHLERSVDVYSQRRTPDIELMGTSTVCTPHQGLSEQDGRRREG